MLLWDTRERDPRIHRRSFPSSTYLTTFHSISSISGISWALSSSVPTSSRHPCDPIYHAFGQGPRVLALSDPPILPLSVSFRQVTYLFPSDRLHASPYTANCPNIQLMILFAVRKQVFICTPGSLLQVTDHFCQHTVLPLVSSVFLKANCVAGAGGHNFVKPFCTNLVLFHSLLLFLTDSLPLPFLLDIASAATHCLP